MQFATPPQSPIVNDQSTCYKCSYALRGLSLKAVCPECGAPVSESMRGILLQYSSQEYIASMRTGHSLVLNGILLMIVAVCITIAGAAVAGAMGGNANVVTVAATGLSTIFQVVIFLGYLKLTEPDPRFAGSGDPTQARSLVRIGAIVSSALGVLSFVAQLLALTSATAAGVMGIVQIIAGILGFVAFAVQFFAMMIYMKWLATRVPDGWIIRRSKTYMWLLPVLYTVGSCLLVGPLIALILYWNLLHRMRKHLISIQENGSPANLPDRAIG
jgi:hypothetical protein